MAWKMPDIVPRAMKRVTEVEKRLGLEEDWIDYQLIN